MFLLYKLNHNYEYYENLKCKNGFRFDKDTKRCIEKIKYTGGFNRYNKKLTTANDLYDENGEKCSTQWSPFQQSTSYFKPSEKQFMMNFRVENLVELLEVLKEEGVIVVGDIEEYDYGKFGWILDPENNKIELWEPNDSVFLENK